MLTALSKLSAIIAAIAYCSNAMLPYDEGLIFDNHYTRSSHNGYSDYYSHKDVDDYDLLKLMGHSGLEYNFRGATPAAITSRKRVEVLPMRLHRDPIEPHVLQVHPIELPVKIVFTSRSSPVHVQQRHIPGGPPQLEKTRTEEEPHRVIHEVYRPVIQEIREVITPYRNIVQEIMPVQENVRTVVAKGDHNDHQYQDNSYDGQESALRKSITVGLRLPFIDSGVGVVGVVGRNNLSGVGDYADTTKATPKRTLNSNKV